jgi:hypothetical protein
MQPSSKPPAPAETSTTADDPGTTGSFPVCEDEVRAALERVLSEEEAREVWLGACEAAQVPRPGPALGPEEITRVVEHLKQQSGTASVVGNSLSVKIRTHKHR